MSDKDPWSLRFLAWTNRLPLWFSIPASGLITAVLFFLAGWLKQGVGMGIALGIVCGTIVMFLGVYFRNRYP